MIFSPAFAIYSFFTCFLPLHDWFIIYLAHCLFFLSFTILLLLLSSFFCDLFILLEFINYLFWCFINLLILSLICSFCKSFLLQFFSWLFVILFLSSIISWFFVYFALLLSLCFSFSFHVSVLYFFVSVSQFYHFSLQNLAFSSFPYFFFFEKQQCKKELKENVIILCFILWDKLWPFPAHNTSLK